MPVILVPRDILRRLPIAQTWDEVADVAGEISNEAATACRVWVYKGHIFARMYPVATEVVELDFGEGYTLPSLVCYTSSHASNYWYIYTV